MGQRGNPVTVDGNPLTYDALDRRVEYYSSSLGYVQYLWAPYDARRNLVIVAPAGPQYELSLPGGSQAILGSSGITEYRRANWQGSEVIDSTTSQTATIDAPFSPYGEHYAENGDPGFSGGNLSIYPFLVDGYAATWRLYHYDQNRWISPDPAGLSAVDPTDPQTWNRYSYARGNPLGNVDPSGLELVSSAGCSFNVTYFYVDGQLTNTTYDLLGCGTFNSNTSYAPTLPPGLNSPRATAQANAPNNPPRIIRCTGEGRGLAGSTSLVGPQGGIPGQTVQLNTAAVTPTQFNVSNGAALTPFAPYIHGTVGGASFNSVTDVNGERSPVRGVPVRMALQRQELLGLAAKALGESYCIF